MLIMVSEYRHYLLAAGGINTDEALRDLDSIDFHTAFEPSSVRVDTDIDVCTIIPFFFLSFLPSLNLEVVMSLTKRNETRPISVTEKNKM